MAHNRWLLVLVIRAMLVGAPLLAQSAGQPAPGFTLKTVDGSRDSLLHYAGHPVLINFWATWCKPCRAEMPWIIDAYRSHQRESLTVLAINLTDQERSAKEIQKFVSEFQLPFPVLLDEKGKARKHYSLRSVPTTILVGSDGVVRRVNPGPVTQAWLQQHLPEVLTHP